MDAFLKKIERLAAMANAASAESLPKPLDCAAVMARIREEASGADWSGEPVLTLPVRFWAGGVAAAAAIAIAVSLFASSAWTEINSPMAVAESLFNVLDVL